jgi:hypothetical protein
VSFAAVIPPECLEMVREVLSRLKVEIAAAEIVWDPARATLLPPQSSFDDDDNPFQPEEDPAS